MEKKLTAQGPRDRKSYTVTLPIEWVKKEGLDKKRSVELDVVGRKVVISAYKEAEKRTVIEGGNYTGTMFKVLQGLYRLGVNEIRLDFRDNEQLEQSVKIIQEKLIGYEIVEQKKDYVIIKDITKESEEEFKTIFRRVFMLLLELPEGETEVQQKTMNRNAKRLINYCQRILMKKGHTDFRKTPLYYLVLDRLEKMCDEFAWLLQTKMAKKKEKEWLKQIMQLFRAGYELFYKFDESKYSRNEHRTYLLKNEIKLGDKIDKPAMHLHNLARLLNSLYGDIFMLKHDE
ncbi:AbrB/MazE/SpoVT family DNA-binding domain-containing protein [Candidatus Woesearchaeota archaeon]|nr:AbrB/MazE/SpoVT family DNA-binding domain-containing protein [Candidatus Woesearchaeota archaeon]